MQSSGPLSSSGTLAQGTHQALVAVMSNAAQASNTFTADTLIVGASSTSQDAARASASVGRIAPRGHAAPVEAFPADDSALTARLHAFAANGVSGAPAQRTTQSTLAGATVGTQASLWVQQGSLGGSRTNVKVPATLALQTAHGNIWIDNSIASALSADLAQIGADFENAYASDTAHFAMPDYPSSAPGLQPQFSSCNSSGAKQGTTGAYIAEPADHRINVMIVSSQNLGGLGGYFSGANYMHQSALNCLGGGYESNEAPFIFVGWFAGSGETYDLKEDLVRSTAHELQHLINFVNHAILAPGASSASFNGNEVSFINEGLSMLAQDFAVQRMYGAEGIQFDAADALARANAYLSNPGNFSVSGFSGVDSPAWGGNGASAQYNCAGGCYGAAYLFERYLHDRFGGDAYTHAMETSGVIGEQNLQSVTGKSPGSLLDDFALAMAGNTLGITAADPRFNFGSLDLTQSYRDQFGGSTALGGVFATPASGASTAVKAPVGGFAYVAFPSVPAAGMPVQVTDQAAASGFGLTGGLAQH
jgi:hypothetical protein